jgi:hypothetical protein
VFLGSGMTIPLPRGTALWTLLVSASSSSAG